MAITTRSVFYYGATITTDNFNLAFNEGASELNAELNVGEYTIESLMVEVERALNDTGSLEYTVSFDRSRRLVNISAPSTFAMLVSTGATAGSSVFSLLGFTGIDQTGASSYTSDSNCGSEYLPQFLFQGYLATIDNKASIEGKVSESGSGITQVASFGTKQLMKCNVTYITDIDQGNGNAIETNASGVADARAFLNNIIGKTKIEFMEDRDARSTYESFILESTKANKDGLGFELYELYAKKRPYYYETKQLTFKKITE